MNEVIWTIKKKQKIEPVVFKGHVSVAEVIKGKILLEGILKPVTVWGVME